MVQFVPQRRERTMLMSAHRFCLERAPAEELFQFVSRNLGIGCQNRSEEHKQGVNTFRKQYLPPFPSRMLFFPSRETPKFTTSHASFLTLFVPFLHLFYQFQFLFSLYLYSFSFTFFPFSPPYFNIFSLYNFRRYIFTPFTVSSQSF